MQADYNRKKKELTKSNEDQLEDLKDYYADKKNNLREENEAAISHIRKRQSEQVDNAVVERQRLNDTYNARTATMQKSFDKQFNDTREKRQQQLADTQESSRQKIEQARDHAQEEVQEIRDKSAKDVTGAKQRYNKEMADVNQFSDKRLSHQREQNEAALATEVERGTLAQEKVRARNEKELTETKQKGDQHVKTEQELQEKKVARVNKDGADRYDKAQKQWASKEENLNKSYTTRLTDNKQAYEKQLDTQTDHFQSTYQHNEEANRESLNVQNERYTREVAETKRNFMKATEKYANKEADPFYKVQNRGTTLEDNGDVYVLRTFVPEHEKDSVKVSIQKDKATVSGTRSFKDKLEDGNKTVSTSSYQTFREDLPFDKPIISEGMTRQREGDWIVYKIPIGGPGGTPRLSRKA